MDNVHPRNPATPDKPIDYKYRESPFWDSFAFDVMLKGFPGWSRAPLPWMDDVGARKEFLPEAWSSNA